MYERKDINFWKDINLQQIGATSRHGVGEKSKILSSCDKNSSPDEKSFMPEIKEYWLNNTINLLLNNSTFKGTLFHSSFRGDPEQYTLIISKEKVYVGKIIYLGANPKQSEKLITKTKSKIITWLTLNKLNIKRLKDLQTHVIDICSPSKAESIIKAIQDQSKITQQKGGERHVFIISETNPLDYVNLRFKYVTKR